MAQQGLRPGVPELSATDLRKHHAALPHELRSPETPTGARVLAQWMRLRPATPAPKSECGFKLWLLPCRASNLHMSLHESRRSYLLLDLTRPTLGLCYSRGVNPKTSLLVSLFLYKEEIKSSRLACFEIPLEPTDV